MIVPLVIDIDSLTAGAHFAEANFVPLFFYLVYEGLH